MMSQKLNEQYNSLKSGVDLLHRCHFLYQGEPLLGDNLRRVRDGFSLWYAVWYEELLSFQDTLGKAWVNTSRQRWLNAISDCDVYQVLSGFELADELLLQFFEIGYPESYESFKRTLRRNLVHTRVLELIGTLKPLVAGIWIDHPDPENPIYYDRVKRLRTAFLFLKKMHLRLPGLRDEAVLKYVALEDSMAEPLNLTSEERAVIAYWFPKALESYWYEAMVPHHGNGAVAEPRVRDIASKNACLKSDVRLDYLKKRIPWLNLPRECADPVYRCSRTTFVPKSYKTYRTISMEPAALMYWQEAGFEAYKTLCLDTTNPLGGFNGFSAVYNPFTGQDDNRRKMLWRDGRFATIDLSSASDLVRLQHVQEWFCDSCLYTTLFCTRSLKTVLPDGTERFLRKFAPMGSALNFLVETIIFAAITYCAMRECGCLRQWDLVSVYGDDIVVPRKAYDAVCDRLERNGFIVNDQKSFHYGAVAFFRESCGLHTLDGFDVTPILISRKFPGYTDLLHHKEDATAIIDLCNAFFGRYRLARRLLIEKLLEFPSHLRPVFGDLGIASATPDNHHLQTFFDVNEQELYYVHGTTKGEKRARSGYDELHEFLRASDGRERLDQPIQPCTRLRGQGAKWACTCTPAFALSVPDYQQPSPAEVARIREIMIRQQLRKEQSQKEYFGRVVEPVRRAPLI